MKTVWSLITLQINAYWSVVSWIEFNYSLFFCWMFSLQCCCSGVWEASCNQQRSSSILWWSFEQNWWVTIPNVLQLMFLVAMGNITKTYSFLTMKLDVEKRHVTGNHNNLEKLSLCASVTLSTCVKKFSKVTAHWGSTHFSFYGMAYHPEHSLLFRLLSSSSLESVMRFSKFRIWAHTI